MKQFKLIASACGLALALGTGAASADIVVDAQGHNVQVDAQPPGNPPPPPQAGPGQKTLVGSDTLNRVMDCLVNGCGSVAALGLAQINNYLGQGSGQGQNQLEGSPAAGTDELPCTVGGASDPNGYPETNPGCEEIAPMSREMNKNICEDDITTPGGVAPAVNLHGESLAICGDGIVITTDNKAIAQTADSAAGCVAGPVSGPTAPTDGFHGNSTNGIPYVPATGYTTAGKLRRSGTIPLSDGTSYVISDWKDVLRLIYTGCKNTDGTCGTVDRYTRCTSLARQAVVNNWYNVVEDGDITKASSDTAVKCDGTGGTPNNALCNNASNPADGGLRHAYRRDDASGTTTFFLGTLGLGSAVGGRAAVASGLPLKLTPISGTANMYCDGGQIEGYMPYATACTPNTGICPDGSTCPAYGNCPPDAALPLLQDACTAGTPNSCHDYLHDQPAARSLTCPATNKCPPQPAFGDPLVKTCRAEDNLCNYTGRMGVVQALISPATVQNVAPYPTLQCTTGACDLVTWISAAYAFCPDGTVPYGNQCFMPYFKKSDGTKDFNCIASKSTRCGGTSPQSSTTDARSFNFVIRDSAGAVKFLATNLPGVAQWRADMAVLKDSPPINGGTINPDITVTTLPHARCTQDDATHLIGCVVANTQCTVGFAGRELGDSPDSIAQGQEPFRVNATVATDPNVLNFLADNGAKWCAMGDGTGSHTVCAANTDCTVSGETCVSAVRAADYPFARFLYLSAIGGFGNITADCIARGGSTQYCADEVKIVNAFFGSNYDTQGGPVCASAGFITLPSTQTDVLGNSQSLRECRGAFGPGASGGLCGATGPARQDGSLAPADGCSPL
jgi:hypothetical protein